MKKPSVTVITKNEAHHIPDFFESVISADDIIILKLGSTANTLAL